MNPHDLLRLDRPAGPAGAPPWVAAALADAPWVVVRRATATAGTIPVGVRGPTRAHRFAYELDGARVAQRVRPEDLADRTGVPDLDRARVALAGRVWGPTGSVGFELATGRPAVTGRSDLDLLIRVTTLPPVDELAALLTALPGRADCLVETPAGGVALKDLVSGSPQVLLRTPTGPVLV